MRKIKNADILILKYASLITTPQATYFKNKNPLEIEIGSGKGMFLISKAFTYPEINFIGVERDATIVLKALRKIEQLTTKPSNLLFINDQAANLHK